MTPAQPTFRLAAARARRGRRIGIPDRMARARAWLAALVAIAGCAVAPILAEESSFVPLGLLSTADIGGLLHVDLELGGRRSRWLLDTGSSRHLVAPALVGRLGLDARGRVNADTAHGRVAGPEVTVPAATLGRVSLGPLSAVVLDLRPLVGAAADSVDGVLGAPLLDQGSVQLDLRDWQMRVSPPVAGRCPDGQRELPLDRRRGVPVFAASVAGGVPERAILDTGNPAAWVRVDGDDAAPQPGTPVPGLPASAARAPEVDWDGVLVRQNVPVVQLRSSSLRSALPSGVAALAGVAFFEGSRLSIDMSLKRACVEPDVRTLPGSFGFTLDQRGDELVVTGVYDGSPAQLAGLRSGDVVARWGAVLSPQSVTEAWARARRESRLDAGFARGGMNRGVELRRAHHLPLLVP